MSAKRRAGRPENGPNRPAGAPPEADGSAGVPGSGRGDRADGAEAERPPAGLDPGEQERPGTGEWEATEGSRVEAEGGEARSVERDLDQLLADTKRERDEYLELAQRTKADFENYRRRVARDTEEAERRGRAALVKGLAPALDNLERALRAAGVDPDASGESPTEPQSEEVSARDALAHGVALVYRELREALARAGAESYDPVGESFDPAWHEALSTRPEEGAEPGTVLETLEKGYRIDGQVVRPARVVVSGS